jgi:hypothetical protein
MVRNFRAVLMVALIFPACANAACSVKEQQTKIARVNALIEENPAQAKALREGLHQSLLLDGEESCVSLDKVIASAK